MQIKPLEILGGGKITWGISLASQHCCLLAGPLGEALEN